MLKLSKKINYIFNEVDIIFKNIKHIEIDYFIYLILYI